jgi:hypothetical protein
MIRYFFYLCILTFTYSSCDFLSPDGTTAACVRDYEFTIPLTFYPKIDTFRINDTFWIECTIPSMLYDTFSMKEYSSWNFPNIIYLSIVERDTVLRFTGADNFEYINLNGNTQRGTLGETRLFLTGFEMQADSSRKISIAFIPKKVGLYSSSIFTLYDDYEFENGVFEEKCNEHITLRFSLYDYDPNNNFELLTGTMSWPNISEMMKSGGYAFRVVE